MAAYKKAQQWATFAQTWHLFDAKWQNPFDSAKVIITHLLGQHKPIYHNRSECGDHVVVINCKEIALPGDEWKRRVYFHHTGYPGGASWTLAWELHEKDPTMIMWKAVYHGIKGTLKRRTDMRRLHLYADDKVPEQILNNVTNQIRQLRKVPRKIESYSEKEIYEYPKLFEFHKDFVDN
ncbi:UNVERIFIED_CONTAM: hypothetical protein PYX00_000647 [Menopon gallinae]|uniref:39S ribosomal protein L13, mitochondrial n=1 Tax=Menopon gallinae TaxID=328185 RepID=A0AAW2I9U9_9NEOP